jgi:hypothetical protein
MVILVEWIGSVDGASRRIGYGTDTEGRKPR